MSAIGKSTPILVTVMLIAGGLACRKPEAVQPEKSKVAVNPAQDNSKAEDAARRQAEAERQRKQDEAVEAARKATALSEAAYQKATEAASRTSTSVSTSPISRRATRPSWWPSPIS